MKNSTSSLEALDVDLGFFALTGDLRHRAGVRRSGLGGKPRGLVERRSADGGLVRRGAWLTVILFCRRRNGSNHDRPADASDLGVARHERPELGGADEVEVDAVVPRVAAAAVFDDDAVRLVLFVRLDARRPAAGC